jgi:hypothetical protein
MYASHIPDTKSQLFSKDGVPSAKLNWKLKESDNSLILHKQRTFYQGDRATYTGSTNDRIQIQIGCGPHQMLDAQSSYLLFNFTTTGTNASSLVNPRNAARLFSQIIISGKDGTQISNVQQQDYLSTVLIDGSVNKEWLYTSGLSVGYGDMSPAISGKTSTSTPPYSPTDSGGVSPNTVVATSGVSKPPGTALVYQNPGGGTTYEVMLHTTPLLQSTVSLIPAQLFPLTLTLVLQNPAQVLNYIGAGTPLNLSPGGTAPTGAVLVPTVTQPDYQISQVFFAASLLTVSDDVVKLSNEIMMKNQFQLDWSSYTSSVQSVPTGANNVELILRKSAVDIKSVYWVVMAQARENSITADASRFEPSSLVSSVQYQVNGQLIPVRPITTQLEHYLAFMESFAIDHDVSHRSLGFDQWQQSAIYGLNFEKDISSNFTGLDTKTSAYLQVDIKFANPTTTAYNVYAWINHTTVLRMDQYGNVMKFE